MREKWKRCVGCVVKGKQKICKRDLEEIQIRSQRKLNDIFGEVEYPRVDLVVGRSFAVRMISRGI